MGWAPLFWQLLRPAATRESRQRRERPISAQRSRARMGGCLLACLLEKFMEPCALVQRPGKRAKRDDRLRRRLKPQADRARSSSARPLSRLVPTRVTKQSSSHTWQCTASHARAPVLAISCRPAPCTDRDDLAGSILIHRTGRCVCGLIRPQRGCHSHSCRRSRSAPPCLPSHERSICAAAWPRVHC